MLGAAGDFDGKVLIDATNNLSGGPARAEIADLEAFAWLVIAYRQGRGPFVYRFEAS